MHDWGYRLSKTYEAMKYGSFVTETAPLNVGAAFTFAGTTPFITLSYYLTEKLKNIVQKDARFHHWVEKYSSNHYQALYTHTERVLNHLCRSLTRDARLQFFEPRYRSSMELAIDFFSRQVIADQFPIVPVIKEEFDTARELLLIACGLSFSCCDSYTKDLLKDIPILRVGFVHKNVHEVLSQFADFEIKLDIFNQISENTKKKKQLRIFVGSLVGDLGPLLKAE
ncbi:Heme oxygenase-like multi-helical isoform 2 [Prunus yedoensis var. nudiflora]|uniref:Heme oxygenase-like multi-helical isoform 2 n=1 Tax=Prunus yedoensis var. nudiflora TaxID=2094558 RepID=A0A314ZIP1_PRUYE|nr:Heme oxygenase-like multi-helical isoform 2 [Prunus yedoensis var. nudiflora]